MIQHLHDPHLPEELRETSQSDLGGNVRSVTFIFDTCVIAKTPKSIFVVGKMMLKIQNIYFLFDEHMGQITRRKTKQIFQEIPAYRPKQCV